MPRYANQLIRCFAIILLSAVSSFASVTCTSAVTANGNNTSAGLNTTGNNFLFVGAAASGGGPLVVKDSAGNAFGYSSANGTGAGTAPIAQIGYVINPITSASDTLSNIFGSFSPVSAMVACSGLLAYGPLAQNGLITAGASSFSMGAVAVNIGDLVLFFAVTNGSAFTVSSAPACLGVTFTNISTANPGADEGYAFYQGVMTQAGSCNPAVTFSANTDWSGIDLVFPAGAPGSGESLPALFGPTATLIVGQANTLLSANATESPASCAPANLSTGSKLVWPATPGFTSDGDMAWTDVNGNSINYWNRHKVPITRFGQTIGAGCVVSIGGSANVSITGFNYGNGPILGTTALVTHPVGLVVDPTTNNVFFADQQNNRVAEIRSSDGFLFTFIGSGPGNLSTCTSGTSTGDGGPPTSATLNCPQDTYISPGQFFLVTEGSGHRIRYVDLTGSVSSPYGVSNLCGGCITTIVGNGTTGCSTSGPGTSANIIQPTGVAVNPVTQAVVWADAAGTTACPRVSQLSTAGIVSPFAGNGTQGFALGAATTTAEFCRPMEVRFDNNGVAYVTDSACAFVAMVRNGVVSLLAGNPSLYGVSGCPGSSCGSNGGMAPSAGSGPARFSALEGIFANGGPSVGPVGATPDNFGNLFITDTGAQRILSMNLPCFGTCMQ